MKRLLCEGELRDNIGSRDNVSGHLTLFLAPQHAFFGTRLFSLVFFSFSPLVPSTDTISFSSLFLRWYHQPIPSVTSTLIGIEPC